MIQRTGEAAKLPFPIHPHMLRHSTGYKLASWPMVTRPRGRCGDDENDGNRCGHPLDGEWRSGATDRGNNSHGPSYQLSRQGRQLVIVALGPAILACHVAAIDVAGFFQAVPKGGQAQHLVRLPEPVAQITGTAGCCALAASGNAAAPPSSVMNSRRFMRGMGSLPRAVRASSYQQATPVRSRFAASPACRRKGQPVFGAGLNRSESGEQPSSPGHLSFVAGNSKRPAGGAPQALSQALSRSGRMAAAHERTGSTI
jgi:hypothetical protein